MKKILTILLITFVFTTNAQNVNLFVKSVEDCRNIDNEKGELKLEVSVQGLKVDDSHQVRLAKVTQAKDDQGNILEMKESFFGSNFSNKGEFLITMSNPSRQASKISIISGEFDYFQPSEANKSKIQVRSPLNKTNINLLDQFNKDTKLLILDKKGLEELKTKNKKEYEAKLKELRSSGVLGEGMAESVDALTNFFEGIFGYDDKEENQLNFYLDDPKKNLVDIIVYDENNKVQNQGTSRWPNLITKSFSKKPTNNWRIEILIGNASSMKTIPFTLESVVLP